jgi:hypothetical protein
MPLILKLFWLVFGRLPVWKKRAAAIMDSPGYGYDVSSTDE